MSKRKNRKTSKRLVVVALYLDLEDLKQCKFTRKKEREKKKKKSVFPLLFSLFF